MAVVALSWVTCGLFLVSVILRTCRAVVAAEQGS